MPKKVIRRSAARRYMPVGIRREVIAQSHSCIYCLLPFGTVVHKPGVGSIVQRATVDHFVSYSWTQKHTIENLVAACQLCNSIKANRVYVDLEDARRYVVKRRLDKSILPMFIPMTALTEEPARWASEYARWLIDSASTSS